MFDSAAQYTKLLETHNSYAEEWGKRQDAQEPQKRRPGTRSRAVARSCTWAQALAGSFMVPENPEAVPGSPAYELWVSSC